LVVHTTAVANVHEIEDLHVLLDLDVLLMDAPLGNYLVEKRGSVRLLWRLSEGEPADVALEPAEAWALPPLPVKVAG
jgi:hypothetical protein